MTRSARSWRRRPLVPLAVFCLTALTLLDRHVPRFLTPDVPEPIQSRLGERSVWEGTVLAPPEAAVSGFRTVIAVEGTKVLLRTGSPAPPPVRRGDAVRFPAKLKKPTRYRNPGSFDYRRALEREGIGLTAFVEDVSDVAVVPRFSGGAAGRIDDARTAIGRRYAAALPAPEAGFLTALMTGDRSGLSAELWDDFRRTGTAHLIAISGQHIALVAGLGYCLFLWCLKRSERLMLRVSVRSWARALALVPVGLYALLAGAPPSVLRACVLAALAAAAAFWRREADAWSALALAAILIGAFDPASVFSVSFQLSFLAVAGILLFARRGDTRLRRWLVNPFWMTVGATLATAPLVAYRFHDVSLTGVLTNLWAVPATGLLLVLAAAALVLPFLLGPLGGATHAFLAGVHASSGVSWVVSYYPTEAEIGFCFAAVAWLAAWRRRSGAWKGIAVSGMVLTLLGFGLRAWDPARPEPGSLQVTFLDVGQGDAAVVVAPNGKSLLVDGGGFLIPWGSDGAPAAGGGFDVGEREIVPYLKRLGLKRVDAILLSHPHPDHFGGLDAVVRAFPVGQFWWSGQGFSDASFERLMKDVAERGIPPTLRRAGESFDWEGCRIEFLYPDGVRPTRNINDNSLVARLSFGEASVLFPGDIEGDGEGALADKVPIRSTILKIPHHASRTSSSVPFIDSVKPDYAVASLGEGNMFGFPHEGILEKYERRGTKIYRTDRDGAVTFTIAPDFPKTPISIRTASSGRSRAPYK